MKLYKVFFKKTSPIGYVKTGDWMFSVAESPMKAGELVIEKVGGEKWGVEITEISRMDEKDVVVEERRESQ